MPDSALQATERQFRDLLAAAAGNRTLDVRVFSFPDLIRGDAARAYMHGRYEDIGALWDTRLDGLIVTGTEPRAPTLAGETYWPSMTKLVDWADHHTTSTIWSCLAAHAAVAHMDGVQREPFNEKLSGVFECARVSDHDIIAGLPARWHIPHSRQNSLPEAALARAGYEILSSAPRVGVDMFMRERGSRFLFLQGHPEYDSGALLREYQRDVARFLSRKTDRYPAMPTGYFDADTTAALCAFRREAERDPRIERLDSLPVSRNGDAPAHSWREPGVRLYSNWLASIE